MHRSAARQSTYPGIFFAVASEDGLLLPLDIIGMVGEHLAANDLHGTCAALNVTSDAVHQQTLHTLYRVWVPWAARVHKRFPPLRCKDSRGWIEIEGGARLNEREDIRDEWERIQKFRGAEYIEYVYSQLSKVSLF